MASDMGKQKNRTKNHHWISLCPISVGLPCCLALKFLLFCLFCSLLRRIIRGTVRNGRGVATPPAWKERKGIRACSFGSASLS
jgi:hypothetical protein